MERQALAFPLAFAALVAGAVAMGASPVFVRGAEIGPFGSAFWRVALALPVLFFWAAAESRSDNAPVLAMSGPVGLAGVFFAGDLIFWHLAIHHTTVANATLMACLAPVWVVLLSGVAIGERVPGTAFLGLGVCLAGAALLIGSSWAIDPQRLIGDAYGMITSLFFGLYFLAVRVARRTVSGGRLIFASSLVTTLCLAVAAAVARDGLFPGSAAGYASLAALGLVSHAGGQGLLAIALGSLTAAFSSLVIFVEAIAAAILGWLVFSEAMDRWQLAGAAMILFGVWVARPRPGVPTRIDRIAGQRK